MKLNKTVLALAVAMCVPAFTACTAANAGNTDSSVMTRAALGDITQYAGARRLTGDMTDNYQAVLDLAKKKHAKNVILLIGDGMGDSEITAARNFAGNQQSEVMKIRKGFVLREMCGETLVTAEGMDNFDFNKVISLNSSAAWLWKEVEGREFDEGTLAGLLLDRYDVDAGTAARDAAALLQTWNDAGLLE